MRKWLLIFVGVSALVITVVLVNCKRQREGEERTEPQSSAVSQAQSGNSAKQSCDCTPKTPCWYILLAWPEGMTVWVVILTFAVIGWQADETRKAARASEVAATASLKQAEQMVNSERAWIMAEANFEHGGGLVWGSGEQTQAVVELSIVNAGPTPAWVYEQWVQLKVSPEVIMSMNKYPSPQFPLIGEGKSAHVNYQIHPVTEGQEPIKWKAYVSDEGIPTEENRLHVYIFGVVRYRDAFNSCRETHFGYVVRNNKRLERIPNEAYNKHT